MKEPSTRGMTTGSLVPFFLITFGLAWGILGLYVFLPGAMIGAFGELTGQHPLFYLSVYAPALAAFIVVLRRTGTPGLRSFVARAGLWRSSPGWAAFLLLGVPLPFIAGAAVKGTLWTLPVPLSSLPLAILMMVLKGPVEEFGWRGFALPILQRKMAPVWAGIMLGIVWGVWHLPAFLIKGTPQNAWSFAPFFLGTVALSIIVTPLYNRSGGSILLAAFFHFQMINPLWPDAQPYDTAFFAALALVVLWVNRKTMFSRSGSAVNVTRFD